MKKLSVGFSWILASLTVIAKIADLLALYAAMIRLPSGIAYPIWTGIGSVGSVVIAMLAFNQSVVVPSISCVNVLIVGMLLPGKDTY